MRGDETKHQLIDLLCEVMRNWGASRARAFWEEGFPDLFKKVKKLRVLTYNIYMLDLLGLEILVLVTNE